MTPSDIQLTDAEILDVEEKVLSAKKRDWLFLVEAVAEMPNSIGSRWQAGVIADDGVQQAEAINQAIISYAKETGAYDEFITAEKERIFEDHQDRIHRRAIG